MDRYVLTFANGSLRGVAGQAPYEFIESWRTTQTYGGGGIFNRSGDRSVDSGRSADYVFVHEFGHGFGALADEYDSSDVAYQTVTPADTEPWEPNVTALLDRAST